MNSPGRFSSIACSCSACNGGFTMNSGPDISSLFV
jgi:hypothetical protein